MNSLSNALPIMVSNYSKLFGITVRIQGTSAYTNGQVITIPRLDMSDPTKARLAYGYLAHEASHVRYTDFSLIKTEKIGENLLLMSLLNILEDCRIEKLIAKEFIGVYENLLLLNDYYESEWKNYCRNIHNYDSISILLSFIQCYAQSNIQHFVSSRPKASFLFYVLKTRVQYEDLKKIIRIIKKSFCANSTQQVLDICKEIYSLVVSLNFKFKEYHSDPEFIKNLGDLNMSLQSVDKMIKSKVAKRNLSLMKEYAKFRNLCQGDFNNATPNKGGAHIIEENSLGTHSSSREDFGLFSDQDCPLGDPDFIKCADPSYGIRMGLRHKVLGYVRHYGKHTYSSNRIDPIKAQKVCLGEVNIFKDRIVARDFSTSVHILVDVSSSMITTDGENNSRAFEACKTALMLSLALENIDGIKTLVTYFPGVRNEFEIALRDNEKVSKVAPRFDQTPRGSTPLAQAFWYALGKVNSLECQRNIVIVITDGMPDSISNTMQCIEYAKKHGVEVYGISIRSEMIKQFFDNAIILESASKLEEKSYELFSKLFDVQKCSYLDLIED